MSKCLREVDEALKHFWVAPRNGAGSAILVTPNNSMITGLTKAIKEDLGSVYTGSAGKITVFTPDGTKVTKQSTLLEANDEEHPYRYTLPDVPTAAPTLVHDSVWVAPRNGAGSAILVTPHNSMITGLKHPYRYTLPDVPSAVALGGTGKVVGRWAGY